jgi:hypothetical protein
MKALFLYAAACLGLVACAAAPPKPAPQSVAAPVTLDPSYDWHVLLTAPMGSLLKNMPVTLHEVLLFRDEAKRSEADEGDCYAIDATAPTFIARVPDEYLLCFQHDRLARIEATVRVPQDLAAKIFTDACALWFKNAALPAPAIGVATESAPAIGVATESAPAMCTGRDGATEFSGRLEVESDRVASDRVASEQDEAQLSIKLDAVEQP